MSELHPDLVPHLDEGPLGPMIRHPLCLAMLVVPELHESINRMYEFKKEQTRDALASRDWSRYLWLHERPWRMTTLIWLNRLHTIRPAEVANVLPDVWADMESPHVHDPRSLRSLFRVAGKVGDELPPGQVFTVWRGASCMRWARHGVCWTLDYDHAKFFANRFRTKESKPTIVRRIVRRDEIAAYFNNRSEQEVVIL